jgi:hypothetical protein
LAYYFGLRTELKVAPLLKFAHRSNLDGTVDSICYRCIATVATVTEEGELLRYEKQHICDPVQAERFSRLRRHLLREVRIPKPAIRLVKR